MANSLEDDLFPLLAGILGHDADNPVAQLALAGSASSSLGARIVSIIRAPG